MQVLRFHLAALRSLGVAQHEICREGEMHFFGAGFRRGEVEGRGVDGLRRGVGVGEFGDGLRERGGAVED